MIRAAQRAKRRGEDPRKLFYEISGEQPDNDRPSRLEVALDVLEDDEWMACVRAWRKMTDGRAITRRATRTNGPPCDGAVPTETITTMNGPDPAGTTTITPPVAAAATTPVGDG